MNTMITSQLDITALRSQFPILNQEVNGRPLVYFDNAATSQTPNVVIDVVSGYYEQDNANIHRGIHALAERATTAYEETRKKGAEFINANEAEEIIFTKGTTEGINLVATAYGRKFLKKGDEIVISTMEHHSNIVPWQMLCAQTGALLKVIPISDQGELDMDAFQELLSERTKIVSVVYISNTLGTINPIKDIVKSAHDVGAKVMVDGAQAAPHLKVDVNDLNCDFLTFSSHKMYGPTGTGILYGKRSLLEKMDPYQGGGEMIKDVSFEKTTYGEIPHKFEAGTPNIADVIAFKAAMEFVTDLGYDGVKQHEDDLLNYANESLNEIAGFQPLGTARNKASVISFNIEGIHAFDLGMLLDTKGIAVRTGHHCTQPLMNRYNIEGTVRASFAVYNTRSEIDVFIGALKDIIFKYIK